MNHSMTGVERRRCVDVNEENECRFWAEQLGVYPGELKEAVQAVGDGVDDLWRYIDERKHGAPSGGA